MKPFSMGPLYHIALCTLCFNAGISLVRAELQIDFKGGSAFAVNDTNYISSESGHLPLKTDPALLLKGTVYGSLHLVSDFSLLIHDQLDFLAAIGEKGNDDDNDSNQVDAATRATPKIPYAERKYTGSNDGLIGVQFKRGPLSVFTGYRNVFYQDPIPLKLSYLKEYSGYSDSTGYYLFKLKRKYSHILNGAIDYSNTIITAAVSTSLFSKNNDIDSIVDYDTTTWTQIDSTINSASFIDTYLRSRASIGVRIPVVNTMASVGALFVNHIGHAHTFDITNYYFAFTGNGNIADNRFGYKVKTDFYHEAYLTDTLKNPYFNSTAGFFQTFYLRNSYTITNGLFAKGLGVLTFGDKILKQRYELAIRKAWQNESWVDIGYFTTMGGLFPCEGMYLRSMVRPIEKLGLGITAKGDWDLPSDTTSPNNIVQFIKAGGNVELSYKIINPIELYASADYTYYNWKMVEDFPNRYLFALGTRIFLP